MASSAFPQQVPEPTNSESGDPSGQRNQENRQSEPVWQRTITDPIAFFTAIVAVFTGVLAASTVGLWIASVKGNRRNARDTEILQRAYIAVEPCGVRNFAHGIQVFGYSSYRNVGRLPARNIQYFSRIEYSPDRDRRDFPVDRPPTWGHNILAPGAVMIQAAETKVSKAQERAVEMGNGYIYVWGTVHYDDGFGKRRWTDFCYRYDHRSRAHDGTVPILDHAFARHHEHGNDAE